jgi:hypothetical protein
LPAANNTDLLNDTERIALEATPFTLSSGREMELLPLKSRQLFRMLKIVTHGARDAMAGGYLDFNLEGGEFGVRLTMLIIMAIPDAEQEALDFVTSMVRPAGLHLAPLSQLTKQQRESNEAKWVEFGAAMYNPDPNDLVDIIVKIVEVEADDLQALGKRLWRMAEPFFKTGQDKEPLTAPPTPQQMAEEDGQLAEPPGAVLAGSPLPSTSSPATTDGATTPSLTFRSGGSARSRQRSVPATSESS